ncbi:MAG TPA: histidinol-phosphate transaminase [Rhodospirillales bacterium]|nr:histidinol-phosphate transaminase [Rhodospirillales bacterium]
MNSDNNLLGSPLKPRPGIAGISPYVGGQSAIDGNDAIIRLASNEGALGPSPKAVEAYRVAAENMYRYPDSGCRELRQALGQTFGLDPNLIVCGAGSDELLDLLTRAYAGPGDEVLYTEHGFLMYPIAAKCVGATPVPVPETDLRADVGRLLENVTQKTRIVFLANPNNPTGTYVTLRELERLRAGLPDNVLLVIDAAYAEYVDRDDYDAGAAMVETHDNVVMTRTFSKLFAMGGMRLGWAYCPAAVTDVLNRLRGPFNVNSAAQAAGVAALADTDFIEKVRRHTARWYDWTKQRLIDLGLDVPSQVGNFLLVRFPAQDDRDNGGRDSVAADEFLQGRGIVVRRMNGYGLPDCLRITIGTEDEMRAVVGALSEFME